MKITEINQAEKIRTTKAAIKKHFSEPDLLVYYIPHTNTYGFMLVEEYTEPGLFWGTKVRKRTILRGEASQTLKRDELLITIKVDNRLENEE